MSLCVWVYMNQVRLLVYNSYMRDPYLKCNIILFSLQSLLSFGCLSNDFTTLSSGLPSSRLWLVSIIQFIVRTCIGLRLINTDGAQMKPPIWNFPEWNTTSSIQALWQCNIHAPYFSQTSRIQPSMIYVDLCKIYWVALVCYSSLTL